MSKQTCTFFLGSNSKSGFKSLFEEVANEHEISEIFIVKSGPGTGKSTAMDHIASQLHGENELRENIVCSSDPDSLDGVILRSHGLAILDGTAPHILEPVMPGAHGGYLALPPQKDVPRLKENYPALLALNQAAKYHYSQAYRLIPAAALLEEHITASVIDSVNQARLSKRALGIASRELPKRSSPGRLRKRLIDGITPKGQLCLFDTVDALAKRVYSLEDNYGLSYLMLEPLCRAALERGHEVYACYCPKNPSRLRHLILPELSLAFVTSTQFQSYPGTPFRRIRLDACVSGEKNATRKNARLMRRLSQSLLNDACEEIDAAKRLHDRIEDIYRPHIDIDAVNEMVRLFVAQR